MRKAFWRMVNAVVFANPVCYLTTSILGMGIVFSLIFRSVA